VQKIAQFTNMKRVISGVIHLVIDVGLYYLALFLAFQLRGLFSGTILGIYFQPDEGILFSSFSTLYWIPVILIILYLYEGLYENKRPFWLDLKSMIKVSVLSTIALFAFMGFVKIPVTFSRFVIVSAVILWLIFTILSHNLLTKLFHQIGLFSKRAVVVGDRAFFKVARKSLHENTYLNYLVNGWVATCTPRRVPDDVAYWKFSHEMNWEELAKKYPYLVVQESFAREEKALLQKLLLCFDELFIIPDEPYNNYLNSDLIFLFSAKVFLTKVHNNLRSWWAKFVKWLFDRILGVIIFIVSLPVIGVILLLIKLDSAGPAIFTQVRIGFKDKEFLTTKFRTMYVNADVDILPKFLKDNPIEAENWKKYKKIMGRDPRVTRIGRILRATSLDELPQIFNVLLGHMSLLGPRPYLPREKEDMKEYLDTIVSVKPGMTGLWQISGRNNLTFEDRMKLDVWYIHNWSLWLDMVILIKTFFVVLSRRGAK